MYYVSPFRFRNLILLVFNLLFYGWGEPVYILLMIFTIVLDYFAGIIVYRCKEKGNDRGARWAVGISLFLNLAILFFFKYWAPWLSRVSPTMRPGSLRMRDWEAAMKPR